MSSLNYLRKGQLYFPQGCLCIIIVIRIKGIQFRSQKQTETEAGGVILSSHVRSPPPSVFLTCHLLHAQIFISDRKLSSSSPHASVMVQCTWVKIKCLIKTSTTLRSYECICRYLSFWLVTSYYWYFEIDRMPLLV